MHSGIYLCSLLPRVCVKCFIMASAGVLESLLTVLSSVKDVNVVHVYLDFYKSPLLLCLCFDNLFICETYTWHSSRFVDYHMHSYIASGHLSCCLAVSGHYHLRNKEIIFCLIYTSDTHSHKQVRVEDEHNKADTRVHTCRLFQDVTLDQV